MTPEQAKEIAIQAHHDQWRRPIVVSPEQATTILATDAYDPFKNPTGYTGVVSETADDYVEIKQSYVSHPIAVAEMLTTDDEKILGYLHDVVEDCKGYRTRHDEDGYFLVTPTKEFKISQDIYYGLNILTHTPDEVYEDYINWFVNEPLPTKVKIADIFHNMSNSPKESSKEKYLKAIKTLLGGLV